jgi:predicted transcriptional regulator
MRPGHIRGSGCQGGSAAEHTHCPTWYPIWVRKTSVYLDDADVERLRRIAAEEGRSQAEIVRAALSAYEQARSAPRAFVLEGSWAGDGSSVADVPEEELLAGFGG